jgi:hypothetical protein
MKKKQSRAAKTGPAKTSSVKADPPKTSAVKTNTAVAPPAGFSFKGVILFFISIIVVFIFFGLDRNKSLLNDRIIPYWDDFQEQKDKTELEERKVNRYGYDYMFPKTVASFFEKKGNVSKVLLLVPTTDYFKQHGVDIHVVEPSVFYYFTGLKTVWAHSPKAVNANWVLTVDKGQLVFDSVTSKAMLMEKIDSFKKYKFDL